jgi:uncharacterized membrane protein (GlpM family)
MLYIFEYSIVFIIGGTLICLLNYFSKQNNTFISAIIPTLPVLFIVGYFLLYNYNGNLVDYSKKACKSIIIYFIFLIILIFLLLHNKNKELLNISISLLCLIIIYFITHKYF